MSGISIVANFISYLLIVVNWILVQLLKIEGDSATSLLTDHIISIV